MRYEKLDVVLREYCAEAGDYGLGRYGLALIFAVKFLNEVMDPRIGVAQVDVRVPVTGRWARFPERMAVGNVCVEVNGNLVPLLPNNAMADPRDGCGTPDDALKGSNGNPDWPAVNIGTTDIRIGRSTYWPGEGGGKSDRGYYRMFGSERLILLDATCRHTHIVLVGQFPTFVPGQATWVPSNAKEAIKAFIKKNISKTEISRLDYVRAVNNMKLAKNATTSAALTAAWRSGDGTIGYH